MTPVTDSAVNVTVEHWHDYSMQVGDKVTWRYEPRGGYGYIMPVAAVVVRIGRSRVQIRVARRVGGAWVQVTRWVSRDKLISRVEAVPAVDVVIGDEDQA